LTYQIERTNPDVVTVRHTDIIAGWEQRYLLISDVHWDSPHCDRAMLKRHLAQAREQSAGILVFGDLLDGMGGKNDKRAVKSTIRPEDQKDNYFDVLVDGATDYFTDYQQNLVMIGEGNHESAVRKHNETDLLSRLCRNLGTNYMGYSGFVRFMFQGQKGSRTTRRLYFHHGYGGGGPVTKGMIGNTRRSSMVDADIFVSGHIHEASVSENVVVKMADSGNVHLATQTHVITPGYKNEFSMVGGFHIEKGRPPKPLGGWWLVFHYMAGQLGNVGYKLERAN
jgi:predicted phosphodiesterase